MPASYPQLKQNPRQAGGRLTTTPDGDNVMAQLNVRSQYYILGNVCQLARGGLSCGRFVKDGGVDGHTGCYDGADGRMYPARANHCQPVSSPARPSQSVHAQVRRAWSHHGACRLDDMPEA